ncbi:MAG: DMT family transporter, partial [Pseudomonadota bacterium]
MTARAATPLFGISCALLAAFAFSGNDVLIRVLSGGYPLHEIVFVRAIFGLLLTIAIIVPLEGGLRHFKTRKLGLHLLRGAFVVMANMTFFTGLVVLPLASATAIFFVAPLMIAVLSIIFLGEAVGPRRWTAIIVGLVGVVIVVQPGGESFQLAALLPVAAALCYAALHILTRKMGGTESAATMAVYAQAIFVVIAGLFGLIAGGGGFLESDHPSLVFLLGAWTEPSLSDVAIMCAAGVGSATGGYLITQAYRTTEAALVAPFEYAALI